MLFLFCKYNKLDTMTVSLIFFLQNIIVFVLSVLPSIGYNYNYTNHGCQDTQHNDTQHNGIQHNNTQHNGIQHNDTRHNRLVCDTQHKRHSKYQGPVLKAIMLSVELHLLLCWVSLCWMSLCWVSLCWMSWRQSMLFRWTDMHLLTREQINICKLFWMRWGTQHIHSILMMPSIPA